MTTFRSTLFFISACIFSLLLAAATASGVTLEEIRSRGTLRHLAVPYAKFSNMKEDGLDCALMKRFAEYLGVTYQFIPTDFSKGFLDVTGVDIKDESKPRDTSKIIGDVFACGLSVLPERDKHVDFSLPTFISEVWLVAKSNSELTPITPSGNEDVDIALTVSKLKGKTVHGVSKTSLDYRNFPYLQEAGATPVNIQYTSTTSTFLYALQRNILFLSESPNVMVGLRQWPYRFKVIGPISRSMRMAAAFAPESVELREEFNKFFIEQWESGEYRKLVEHYYPGASTFLSSFLEKSTP